MSRRSHTQAKVELFPFLAVLVCVMGALIFLLLVMTKQLRANSIARAQAEALQPLPVHEEDFALPLPPAATWDDHDNVASFEPPTRPDDSQAASSAAEVAARARAEYEAAQAAQRQTWQDRVAALERELESRRTQRNREQLLAQTTEAQATRLQKELLQRELELAELMGRQSAEEDRDKSRADERSRLEQQIQALRRQLKQLQDQQRDASSRYAVVPYDGKSGTTRRPILVECTATGIRFIPEDVTLTPADIDGFVPRFNPLAAGAQALIEHWNQPQHREQGEPYVMLIVRPDGTLAYYIAMRLLSGMQRSFGYELVAHDTQLQIPPLDPQAKQAVEEAVRRVLLEREQAVLSLGKGSGGGAGGTGAGRGPSGNRGPGQEQPSGRGGSQEAIPAPPASRSGGTAPGRTTGTNVSNSTSNASREFNLTQLESPPQVGDRSWQDLDRFEGQEFRRRSSQGKNTATTATPEARNAGGPAAESSSRSSTAPSGERGAADTGSSASTARSGTEGNTGSTGSPYLDEPAESFPRFNPPSSQRAGQQAKLPYEQLQRRKWGPHEPGASIGVERRVVVQVDSERVIIDGQRSIPIRPEDSRTVVFDQLLVGLDQAAQTWGQPGSGFFWVPSLKFVISPGGNAVYERMAPLVTKSGLSHSLEHTLERAQVIERETQP